MRNPATKGVIAVIENGLISTYTMREALMKTLLEEGFEVFVLTHSNHHQKEVEASGIKVIDIGSGNTNPIKVSKYIIKLYRHLNRIKPDICLTFSVRPAVWGNFITRLLRIPTITNITGIGPLFESKSFVYKVIRKLYPLALQKTYKIFFQNYDDLNLFVEQGLARKDKSFRIPGSGIDPIKFNPCPDSRDPKMPFTFLFIGRLILDKGIMEYIEASKRLKSKFPDIVFKIIGPFWEQNLKLNQVSRSIIDSMVKSGIIDYLGEKKDVRKYLANADCIVLPSYREGTSNVLLESASMQKPIVTTDTTGCREIVEDGVNGYLCRVRDSIDLANKMEKMYLLSDEERLNMGKKGREKVIREFDKQIVLNAYLTTIAEILSSPRK